MSRTEIRVATLDLVPLLLRSVSNQKICTLLTLQGHLDIGILSKALRYLLRHNPVLASELVISRGKPLWRPRSNTRRDAIPQLIHTTTPDELLNAHPAALVAGRGGTLEIRVYRGAQHDALCITTDHTAADAAGCRELVRQLSVLYSRLECGEEFIIGAPTSRERDIDCIRAQLGTARSLLCLTRPGMAPPRWQFGMRTGNPPPKPVYLLRQFEAGGKGGLQAIGRRHKATINDLLLAALFRALSATMPADVSRPLPVQLTVDLRRYLPAGQRGRIANLSGTDCVWLDPARAGRFHTLVADTHRAMNRIKNRTPGAGSSMWLKLLFTLGFERVRQYMQKTFSASRSNGLNNPLLTNFGPLDGDALSFGTTGIRHACITAPNLLAPGVVIGASTFRNTLTLSTGFDANTADPAWVSGILDRMISDLAS